MLPKGSMKTRSILALTAFAALVAAAALPADAQSNGMLRTMPHGDYQCALPGDAGGAAYTPVPSENFTLGAASGYTNAAGNGTYILRGDAFTFTRGPKKGQKYRRVGTNQLQVVADNGQLGRMICTRRGGAR